MARRGVFDAILNKEEYVVPEQIAVPVKLPDATMQDPDELVECPYDKAHRIRVSRFPMHLLKCRKNYTGKDMYTCPFNARHLVPAPEARHHIANCPDKAAVERDMVHGYDISNTYCRGYVKVPSYHRNDDFNVEPTENWDEEIQTDRAREYWGPEVGSGDRSGGASHLPRPRGRGAPRAVGNNNPQQPAMRLPRQPAQAAAIAQQRLEQRQQQQYEPPQPTAPSINAQAPPVRVAGLGRGQSKGRVIAANLWGSQPQSGGSMPPSQQPARPGGLGQSSWAAEMNGPSQNGPTADLTVDDFPPLSAPRPATVGLGRGLGRGATILKNQAAHASVPGGLQDRDM